MTSALYIHIPFCEKRCGYCDFYTVADRQEQIPTYLAALKKEMAVYAQHDNIRKLTFATVFLGGGTPSLLTAAQISELIAAAFYCFSFNSEIEITLETNPGTVDLKKLRKLHATGVNRLSIGIQSFHDHELSFLDRIHSATEAETSVVDARAAGFDNISVDLIFGLPDQTINDWQHNLQHAVRLQPQHISAYNLTYEAGTPLTVKMAANLFDTTPEPLQRDMHLRTIDYLIASGYQHYEISNYCLPGFESQHNSKYWDGSPYLGIGASAHSFIDGKRFWNVSNYAIYMQKLQEDCLPVAAEEILDQENISVEAIWLGLRQRQGLNLRLYEQITGEPFLNKHRSRLRKFFPDTQLQNKISALTSGQTSLTGELLNIEDGYLRLTDRGVVVCDAICAEFI